MDNAHMNAAISLARAAISHGDVPVGCVITLGGVIIAEGRNTRERDGDALGHAELNAIAAACAALGRWRLSDCELFVTLEPCAMCAGAILNARIGRVVYGATDAIAGAFGGAFDLLRERLPFKPEVFGGFMEAECAALLSGFFRELR